MKFSDLFVVETGVGMAAPLVTRVLADLGASAAKLESRGRVDFNRGRLKPPGMTDDEFDDIWPQIHDMSSGKASVTANLKHEDGRRVLLELLDRADVWIENYVPGWLERLGLSLEEIQERCPQLVILSQSPRGSTGPKRTQRAYAPIMTSLAGLESLVGYEDGRVISQVSSAVGDLVAAYYGALLVLSALYERTRTGFGAVIDQSQTESSVALVGLALAEYGLSGKVPRPVGNTSTEASPHGIYPAAGVDRWVALAVWDDTEWWQLSQAFDLPTDQRDEFSELDVRLTRRGELDALVVTRTALFERDDLCRRLQQRGLSCTPVLDCYEADVYPPATERGLLTPFAGPRETEVVITRIPWRFDHLPMRPQALAEPLGTSTEAVLRERLGYDEAEISQLVQSGALD